MRPHRASWVWTSPVNPNSVVSGLLTVTINLGRKRYHPCNIRSIIRDSPRSRSNRHRSRVLRQVNSLILKPNPPNQSASARRPSMHSFRNNAGFIEFLKQHSSPQHQRVTAGGRIVPMNPRSAEADPWVPLVDRVSTSPPVMGQPFVEGQTTTMSDARPTGTENVRLVGSATQHSENAEDDLAAMPFVSNQESAQREVNTASPGHRERSPPFISYIQEPVVEEDGEDLIVCRCRSCMQDDPIHIPEDAQRRWDLYERDINSTMQEIAGMWHYLDLGDWPPPLYYFRFAEELIIENSDTWEEGEILLTHKLNTHERYLSEINQAIAMSPISNGVLLDRRIENTMHRGKLREAIALLDEKRFMFRDRNGQTIAAAPTANAISRDDQEPEESPLFQLPGPSRSIPIIDPSTGEEVGISSTTQSPDSGYHIIINPITPASAAAANECCGDRGLVALTGEQGDRAQGTVHRSQDPLEIVPRESGGLNTANDQLFEGHSEHGDTRYHHAASRHISRDSEETLVSPNAEEHAQVVTPDSGETLVPFTGEEDEFHPRDSSLTFVRSTEERAEQSTLHHSGEGLRSFNGSIGSFSESVRRQQARVQDYEDVSLLVEDFDRVLNLHNGVHSLPRNFAMASDDIPWDAEDVWDLAFNPGNRWHSLPWNFGRDSVPGILDFFHQNQRRNVNNGDNEAVRTTDASTNSPVDWDNIMRLTCPSPTPSDPNDDWNLGRADVSVHSTPQPSNSEAAPQVEPKGGYLPSTSMSGTHDIRATNTFPQPMSEANANAGDSDVNTPLGNEGPEAWTDDSPLSRSQPLVVVKFPDNDLRVPRSIQDGSLNMGPDARVVDSPLPPSQPLVLATIPDNDLRVPHPSDDGCVDMDGSREFSGLSCESSSQRLDSPDVATAESTGSRTVLRFQGSHRRRHNARASLVASLQHFLPFVTLRDGGSMAAAFGFTEPDRVAGRSQRLWIMTRLNRHSDGHFTAAALVNTSRINAQAQQDWLRIEFPTL